jgi:hypothetical protein
MSELVIEVPLTQMSLDLAGQAPVPLVSWIGHTEGVTAPGTLCIIVTPADAAGSAFLQANIGKTFTGNNGLVVTQGAVPTVEMQSQTAQILAAPPDGSPLKGLPRPAAGGFPTVTIIFGR